MLTEILRMLIPQQMKYCLTREPVSKEKQKLPVIQKHEGRKHNLYKVHQQ